VLVWLAFQQTGGSMLVVYLLGAIVLFALLLVIIYRGYALLQGLYSLKRDGLRIRWGLRAEDIPLSEVKWVRPATDLEKPLRLPLFSLPGALLGKVEHTDLGPVEFIASSARCLVIVATIHKTFVLSPDNFEEFVQRFQRALEMGTINPMEPCSSVPAAFVSEILSDKFGRALIPSGMGLTLALLVLISLSIPKRLTVSIGFDQNGKLLPAVASSRLLLLPVLGILLYVIGTVLGIYFYRKVETRPVAWLVWTGNVLMPILLIVASSILLHAA